MKSAKVDKWERGKEFQADWFKAFPWLDEEKSKEKNAFVCKPCTITKQDCSFNLSQGGAYKNNLRRDKLGEHAATATHKRAELEIAKQKTQPTMDIAPLTPAQRESVLKRAKLLLWLATEEVAHAKFGSLCALVEDIGVKFPGLDASNAKYTSAAFTRQMLESLAWVVENKFIQHVQKSPAVSVIVDDSTDEANIKQLCVMVRYLHAGESHIAFLGLVDIPDGGAESVYNAASKLITDKGITPQQLVGFGSDGASPMTGEFAECFRSRLLQDTKPVWPSDSRS